jgi:hypothetical protein
MPIDLVITDLDGTAIPNVQWTHPTPRVIRAVHDAQRAGFHIAAATGRPWRNSKAILAELGLVDPCVLAGGTRVVDPTTGEILWSAELSDDSLEAILAAAEGLAIEVLTGEELGGEGAPPHHRTSTDLRANGGNVVYLENLEPTDAARVLSTLSTHDQLLAVGVTSWSSGCINVHITPVGATKSHAIAVVQRLVGSNEAASVGVGDGGNDVALLAAVGLGVAMSGSQLAALDCADVLAPSVDHDGFAWVLESLIADPTAQTLRSTSQR